MKSAVCPHVKRNIQLFFVLINQQIIQKTIKRAYELIMYMMYIYTYIIYIYYIYIYCVYYFYICEIIILHYYSFYQILKQNINNDIRKSN